MDLPESDLSRAVSREAARPEWPGLLVISAIWPDGEITQTTIDPDKFYGVKTGAPMGGAELLGMVERLVRAGPPQQ